MNIDLEKFVRRYKRVVEAGTLQLPQAPLPFCLFDLARHPFRMQTCPLANSTELAEGGVS